MYDGVFSTPKTEAGTRRIPLSDTALTLIAEWKAYVGDVKPDALMFSTKTGTPIPAARAPGKVVAQLMGHANVDTTLNVYTQVLDGSLCEAVDKVGGELFIIVHKTGRTTRGPQRK